jgi:hypothetical protein
MLLKKILWENKFLATNGSPCARPSNIIPDPEHTVYGSLVASAA